MQKPDLSEHSHLADKLDELLSDCVVRHVFPDLAARMEKLQMATSKSASLMLRKGRRLTEQTLDSCQMKRIKAATVQVEVKHLACHMANWNMLGQDFLLPDLVVATLLAKHRCVPMRHCTSHRHQRNGRLHRGVVSNLVLLQNT